MANYPPRLVRSPDVCPQLASETAHMANADRRKWWTLGAVSIGLFMVMLDNTVVNVALPTISRTLGMGMSSLEWVVNG